MTRPGDNDVATPARAGDGAPETPLLDFRSCDISDIVRRGVARASEASPSVVVEVNTPPSLPAAAEAEALGGVVSLLVDTACRRSEAGVNVRVRRGDEGITVQVVDRGPGLDRKKIAAAFAETVRPGEELAGRDRSLVGLNLARSLVTLHGGILWAEPLPAGGNRVAFTIPEEPTPLEGPELEAAEEVRQLLSELDVLSAPERPGPDQPVDPGHRYLLDQAADETAALDVEVIADLVAAELASAAVEPSSPVTELVPHEVIELELRPLTVESEPAPLAEAAPLDEESVEEVAEIEAIEGVQVPEPEPRRRWSRRRKRSRNRRPSPERQVVREPEEVQEAKLIPEPQMAVEPQLIEETPAIPEPQLVAEAPPTAEPFVAAEAATAMDPQAIADPSADLEPEITPEPQAALTPEAEAAPSEDQGTELSSRQVRAVRPSFTLDPLHPATQMLRGLSLDYDSDPLR